MHGFRIHIVLWLVCMGISLPQLRAQVPDSARAESDSTRIEILHANLLTYQSKDGIGIQKLIGAVELLHDSTLFYCDSAYYLQTQNRLEAFSNIRILMQDSVTLTADHLIYDTKTKVAEVLGDIVLTDGDAVLTTEKMIYFRSEKYGFYENGGKLINQTDTLTSAYGYYYPQEDMAYFKQKVVLKSPDYTLETDTLGYHTEDERATFLTYTLINSKDGQIETSKGTYESVGKKVNLYSRSTVRDTTYTLSADTLFYDEVSNLGFARGNVVIVQEDSSLEIRGQLGRFNRVTEESYVTQNPVAIQFMDDDTLYIFADTLYSVKERRWVLKTDTLLGVDSLSLANDSLISTGDPLDSLAHLLAEKPKVDSLISDSLSAASLPNDSLRVDSLVQDSITFSQLPGDSVEFRTFKAYQHVRFFMKKMQGRTDSLVYFFDDSLLHLYQDPVLWSEENQLSGDVIQVWMKNEQADSMWIGGKAFVASQEDTVGFNQIKGKEIRAKFRDNSLARLHVIGNSESIYFAKNESDSTETTYDGMNQALAQEMIMYFADDELQKILFLAKPQGTFHPYFEIVFSENKLEGMRWRISERPDRPDIFPILPAQPLQEAPVPGDAPASEEAAIPVDPELIEPEKENP